MPVRETRTVRPEIRRVGGAALATTVERGLRFLRGWDLGDGERLVQSVGATEQAI